MPTFVHYTKDELAHKLKVFAEEKGFTPSMSDVRQSLNMPSPYTYKKRFGSWSNALKAAGLNFNYVRRRPAYSWSRDEILQWVRVFYARENRAPTRRDFQADPQAPSTETIRKLFGSLNNCWGQAGISFRAAPMYANLTHSMYLQHRLFNRQLTLAERMVVFVLRRIGHWLKI